MVSFKTKNSPCFIPNLNSCVGYSSPFFHPHTSIHTFQGLSLPFSQQLQFTLIVNVVNLNYRGKSSKLKNYTARQSRKRVNYDQSSFNDRHHGFELSRSVDHHIYFVLSLTVVYTCQDHVLESLKMAFVFVILDSKYSKMTPKFVKQKSQWLHSSIKFTNPVKKLINNLWAEQPITSAKICHMLMF